MWLENRNKQTFVIIKVHFKNGPHKKALEYHKHSLHVFCTPASFCRSEFIESYILVQIQTEKTEYDTIMKCFIFFTVFSLFRFLFCVWLCLLNAARVLKLLKMFSYCLMSDLFVQLMKYIYNVLFQRYLHF